MIKTPVSVWLLLALASVSLVRAESARRAATVCAIPILLLLFVSFFDITSPGIRRILIVVPFLLIVAGLALAREVGRWTRSLAWGAALASVVAVQLIYPHHLSYVNPLFGGPEVGPYMLDESNIDWGQDLPALARWQQNNAPDEVLSIYYFGSADPTAYGVHALQLDVSEIEHPQPGLKAISAHFLAGLHKQEALRGWDSDWLSKYEPIAKAGYSIFIYRFPESGDP